MVRNGFGEWLWDGWRMAFGDFSDFTAICIYKSRLSFQRRILWPGTTCSMHAWPTFAIVPGHVPTIAHPNWTENRAESPASQQVRCALFAAWDECCCRGNSHTLSVWTFWKDGRVTKSQPNGTRQARPENPVEWLAYYLLKNNKMGDELKLGYRLCMAAEFHTFAQMRHVPLDTSNQAWWKHAR